MSATGLDLCVFRSCISDGHLPNASCHNPRPLPEMALGHWIGSVRGWGVSGAAPQAGSAGSGTQGSPSGMVAVREGVPRAVSLALRTPRWHWEGWEMTAH